MSSRSEVKSKFEVERHVLAMYFRNKIMFFRHVINIFTAMT